MTLQEFLQMNNGKYIEVAGSPDARNQCVDAVNAYIRDVLQLPIIEWTNAVDFPSKAGDKYDFIKNTTNNVPLEGDLVIWSGGVGHIAVFIEGDAKRFTSFDQNYPTGSPCHIQNHSYTNVAGWLRAKKAPVAVYDQAAHDRIQELDGKIARVESERDQLKNQVEQLNNELVLTKNSPKTVEVIKEVEVPTPVANIPTSTLWAELGRRLLGR